jgi:hypothetical protein
LNNAFDAHCLETSARKLVDSLTKAWPRSSANGPNGLRGVVGALTRSENGNIGDEDVDLALRFLLDDPQAAVVRTHVPQPPAGIDDHLADADIF